MIKILDYLNPIKQLGKKNYSFLFPLIFNIIVFILSEFLSYKILKDPNIVGTYIIFVNVILIIYFSLRNGVIGGFTTSTLTILYYLYIIETRSYTNGKFIAGVETTIYLGLIYFGLSAIIGGLKQTVDSLIEKEADGRKQLETIVEQLPVGIIISDATGKVIHQNKQLENIIDMKIPTEFIYGEELLLNAEINNKPLNASQAPILTALKGKKLKNENITIQKKDGKKTFLQVSAAPILNKKGKIIAAAEIINDITIQRELEEKKDDFINMASHELKTPLTSATVFAQILKKRFQKSQDSESEKVIKKIDLQLNKLTDLVKELLDVTRLYKGGLKVEKEKFLVKELAKEIVEDLQPTTFHKLKLDWHTKLYVYADKERIRQVLTNLVTNAIKYSKADKDIIIGSRPKKNTIEIYVKDFGIGIPKIAHKKIFDRFYQVRGHETYPGLGLGLYISSQIIKLHKGKLWVESSEGKGSTFYFSLPVSSSL